jgi:hypothetical protein
MGPFVQEHELNRFHFLPPFSMAGDPCLLSPPEDQPSVKNYDGLYMGSQIFQTVVKYKLLRDFLPIENRPKDDFLD